MVSRVSCSSCGAPPAFICLCTDLAFCAGECFVEHLTVSRDGLHSTLPISQQHVFEPSISPSEIIYRNAVSEALSDHVQVKTAELDRFVLESSSKITLRSQQIQDYLAKLVEAKSEAIRTECDTATTELQRLLDDLNNYDKISDRNSPGVLLVDYIMKRALDLKVLTFIDLSYSSSKCEAVYKSFAEATVKFPAMALNLLMIDEAAAQKLIKEKKLREWELTRTVHEAAEDAAFEMFDIFNED